VLSASLKLAETDLIDSRKHVQRFQEISQASEDALASLNAAFDQYKLDTDRQLSEKTVR
jgi:nucleoprotein TPR